MIGVSFWGIFLLCGMPLLLGLSAGFTVASMLCYWRATERTIADEMSADVAERLTSFHEHPSGFCEDIAGCVLCSAVSRVMMGAASEHL